MKIALYVLHLSGGRYYVGTTQHIAKRIQAHVRGQGTQWTTKYPVLGVLHIKYYTNLSLARDAENHETKRLMAIPGDLVRGGNWCHMTDKDKVNPYGYMPYVSKLQTRIAKLDYCLGTVSEFDICLDLKLLGVIHSRAYI